MQASVAAALVADALQRGAAAGNTAFREFAAALHSRAADWKSAYAGLASRIVLLARRRSAPPPDFKSEYADTAEPAD